VHGRRASPWCAAVRPRDIPATTSGAVPPAAGTDFPIPAFLDTRGRRQFRQSLGAFIRRRTGFYSDLVIGTFTVSADSAVGSFTVTSRIPSWYVATVPAGSALLGNDMVRRKLP